MIVKIRFNVQHGESDLVWRVLIDGVERLASHIHINTPTWTTKDFIEGVGDKWHITCEAETIEWNGTEVVIEPINLNV